jgi:hypothetical protein
MFRLVLIVLIVDFPEHLTEDDDDTIDETSKATQSSSPWNQDELCEKPVLSDKSKEEHHSESEEDSQKASSDGDTICTDAEDESGESDVETSFNESDKECKTSKVTSKTNSVMSKVTCSADTEDLQSKKRKVGVRYIQSTESDGETNFSEARGKSKKIRKVVLKVEYGKPELAHHSDSEDSEEEYTHKVQFSKSGKVSHKDKPGKSKVSYRIDSEDEYYSEEEKTHKVSSSKSGQLHQKVKQRKVTVRKRWTEDQLKLLASLDPCDGSAPGFELIEKARRRHRILSIFTKEQIKSRFVYWKNVGH